jgi:hypothetical protein
MPAPEAPATRQRGVFADGDTIAFTTDSTATADEFAEALAAYQLPLVADTAAYPKTAGQLRLPLANGQLFILEDDGEEDGQDDFVRHTYLGFFPTIGCYAVEYLAYESKGCYLLERADSTQHFFSELPTLSPGNHWLAGPYYDWETIGPPYEVYLDLRRIKAGRLGTDPLSAVVWEDGQLTDAGQLALQLPGPIQQLRSCWAGPHTLLVEVELTNRATVYWRWQAEQP